MIGFKYEDPKVDYEINFILSDDEKDYVEEIKKELDDMHIKWVSVTGGPHGYRLHVLVHDEKDIDKLEEDLNLKMISKYRTKINDATGHEWWS